MAAHVFTDLSAYLPHGIAEVGRVFVVPTTRVLVPLGSVTHWDCKLSVARPSAYLGELELAERHAASRIARTGGLGAFRDGTALRAFLGGALGSVRESIGLIACAGFGSWHKSGTVGKRRTSLSG